MREDRGSTNREEREQKERTVRRGQGRIQGGERTGMGDYRKEIGQRGERTGKREDRGNEQWGEDMERTVRREDSEGT